MLFARQRAGQRPFHAAPEQRPELGGAVQVEQHQIAAVGRQAGVKGVDQRAGADREVQHRVERQDGRQLVQGALALPGGDVLLQHAGQLIRLARRVHRKRVVLERIELRHDAQPGCLGEGRQYRGQPGQAGKARKLRDADHGRDQDQAVRPGLPGVVDGVHGVHQGKRSAVGKAHDMQGLRRGHAPPRLAHRQPRRRGPVLPGGVGQAARHRAMPRQADRHHRIARVAVMRGNMSQAVGRIGQPVQQDRHAGGVTVGIERIRQVPIVRKTRGIDHRAAEIAVALGPVFRLQLLGHLLADLGEDLLFARQVILPGAVIERVAAQFFGNIGMPDGQRRTLMDVEETDAYRRGQENGNDQAKHAQGFPGPAPGGASRPRG
ncbi:hypothetical protein D9M68_653730 [compost metagenome]